MESIQELKIVIQSRGEKGPDQLTHNGFFFVYTFNFKIKLKRNNLVTPIEEVFISCASQLKMNSGLRKPHYLPVADLDFSFLAEHKSGSGHIRHFFQFVFSLLSWKTM